ncbi:hypothetical protein [Nocardia ignorata]|uniref:Uncharacterized protein n=1 Tax=Nocardia ignorata TaxID=145285 RepID=A0A4R6NYU9_NOCIG|nr:hypothetical protein [Nocardia ignorata]TDP28394.1 hypothetical protein DFR75_1177 [Nocardia ignorata]
MRRKAPLSSILWQRIMRRHYGSSGLFPMQLAWTHCDAGLEVSFGAPGDNHLTIHIDNPTDPTLATIVAPTIAIPLTYRQARAIDAGLSRAGRISHRLGRLAQD